MIAGFAALEDAGGRPRRVLGIDASATIDKTRDQVRRIAQHTADLIGLGRQLRDDEVTVLEGWAGDLYGIPVASTVEAIKLSGRLEGMIIDPVYEGKSMAGLVDLVTSGEIPAGLDGPLRPPRRAARPQRLLGDLRLRWSGATGWANVQPRSARASRRNRTAIGPTPWAAPARPR